MPISGLVKLSLDSKDALTTTSTTDIIGIGTLALDSSTNTILQWVKNAEAATSTAIGDALVLASTGTAFNVNLSGATADLPLVGFAAAVIAAGSYGWMYVYGPGYVLLDGTTDVAIGDALSTVTTAKTLAKGDEQTVAVAMVAWTTDSAAVKAAFIKCL